MHRVTHDKEMDLMHPMTNRRNLEEFSDLLPNFFYDIETEKEILANLSPLTKPFPHNHLDKILNLNSQFRAWYEIPIDEENDLAWEQYSRMIYNNITHFKYATREYKEHGYISTYNGNKQPSEEELLKIKKIKICEDYGLEEYETFATNKISIGKNTRKLFRFCLQKNILTKEQVDRLNTLNTKERHLYVCLSRNPIDYLFCSTNQSYSSCIGFDSVGEGCYWMGLGALNVDTSRALIFLSNGKLRSHTIKGHKFKHYGYLSRSWVIVGKHNELFITGAYPEDKIGFEDKLEKVGYVCPVYGNFKQSILSFRMSRFEDGAECNIYLDTFGVECRTKTEMSKKKIGNKHRTWYYCSNGATGSLHHFDYDGEFENLRYFEDLYEGNNYCEDCGNHFRDDDGYYFENIGSICYDCYSSNYVTCNHCGDAVHDRDSFLGADSCDYCKGCFDDKYVLCGCGEAIEKDYAYTVDCETYCEDCVDQYCFMCADCEDYFINDDRWVHGAGEYCRECYDQLFVDCDECSKTMSYEDAIEIDYSTYCKNCAETIEEEKRNEAINDSI